MRKRVRRALALVMAAAFMMSTVSDRQLFVSAENAVSSEEVASLAEDAVHEEASEQVSEMDVPAAAVIEPAPAAQEETPVEAEPDVPEEGTLEAEPTVPVEETPAEEPVVPVEETPAEEPEAPVEEAPAEEPAVPVEEAPAEEPVELMSMALTVDEEVMPMALTSVTIQDDIINSGTLKAVVSGATEDESLSYQWYELVNGQWAVIEDTATVDSKEASYYVARDGAQKTYKIAVTDSTGNTLESSSFTVPYYDALQNGSFEMPVVSESNYYTYNKSHFIQIPNGTAGLEWKTSASGPRWSAQGANDYYIEIADGSNKEYGTWGKTENDPSDVYNISAAADGDQFAELNCQVSGALYQDILTQPGSTLYWGLEHAGRGGDDTMAVIISNTKELPSDWNPTEENYNSRPSDVQATITDGRGICNYHTGTYVVPEGQYVTRFYFVAVSAANGVADGNLLDNISFSKDVPNPPASKGNLTISKKVDGIDQEIVPAESFRFEIKDEEENVTMVALPSKAGEWSCHITNLSPGTYTVVESVESIEGYELSSTSYSVNDEESADGKTSSCEVKKKETTVIEYTNTYIPSTANLTVKKVFEGLEEDKVRKLIGDGLQFQADYEDSSGENAGNYTFAAKDHLENNLTGSGTTWTYSYTISDALKNKEYTIAELNDQISGYQCSSEVEVSGAVTQVKTSVKQAEPFMLIGDTTVQFTNTYVVNGDLVINKTIDGIDSSLLTDLKFVVTDSQDETVAEITLTDMTKSQDGSFTYRLNAVEPGTYTVTESGYDVADYECINEYQVNGQEKTAGVSASVMLKTASTETISFVNTYASLLRNVTVKKLVDGNMGDRDHAFSFTYQINNGEKKTFTLSSGGEYRIPDLIRKNDQVIVKETDYTGYDVSVGVEDGTADSDTEDVAEYSASILDDTTVVFTNTKNVDPPTGIVRDSAPYLLMMLASIGCIALFIIRRRRV